MASLDFQPLSFPWQLFLEAQQAKNRNQQQMFQDIAGIGTGLGDIGKTAQKQRAQNTIAQALSAMRTNQIPDQTGAGLTLGPGGMTSPLNPMNALQAPQQPAVQTPELMQALLTTQPELGGKMLAAQFDPLVQSEIAKNNRTANASSMESMVDVFRGPDGKLSNVEKPGFVKIGQVPLKEAYQYGMAGQLAETKQGFASQRDIQKQWNDLQKTVNPFRSQGIGGSASVFNKAAVANQAAARGLKILNKPSLTWQELNAYVNTDIASIQRGGTPTDIQLHESNYNTLSGKLGAFQTFVSGKPATGLVPSETRNQIRQNIMDIIGVDNQIIDDGIDYAEQAYPDAVRAFPTRWENIKKQAAKIKAVGQDGEAKLGANPVGGGITKPDEEEAYQAFKRSQSGGGS